MRQLTFKDDAGAIFTLLMPKAQVHEAEHYYCDLLRYKLIRIRTVHA